MTGIHVTVGPAIESTEVLRVLIGYGVRGFRFPVSKVSWEVLTARAEKVAGVAAAIGAEVDLMVDLPGAKLQLTNDIDIRLSEIDRITVRFTGGEDFVEGTRPEVGLIGLPDPSLIRLGDTLLLGDGQDALRVESVAREQFLARPLTNGVVGRRRGVTIVGRPVPRGGLTEADALTLASVADSPFTAVMLSFVEDAATVELARDRLHAARPDDNVGPAVVAKLETGAGVTNAAAIGAAADGILLARGDLLLSVGELEFHDACRRALRTAQAAGTPLMVGTQLLTTMSDSWLPHRSELVALCQLAEEGVAGLLLSDETTVGRQPDRTVRLLAALIARYGALSTCALFPTSALRTARSGSPTRERRTLPR